LCSLTTWRTVRNMLHWLLSGMTSTYRRMFGWKLGLLDRFWWKFVMVGKWAGVFFPSARTSGLRVRWNMRLEPSCQRPWR
jgi:hypothetical protein